jgi:hypothetical protein
MTPDISVYIEIWRPDDKGYSLVAEILFPVGNLLLLHGYVQSRFRRWTVYDPMSVEVIYAPGYIDQSLVV